MSSLLHPVGPQRAGTYWRRRAVVVALIVGVLALVCFLLFKVLSSGGDSDDGGAALPNTGEAQACSADDIKVSLVRYKREWANGELPAFTGTVLNTSASPCQIDTGKDVTLLVVSGSDRIYSSADCPLGGESQLVTIEPEATQQITVQWNRQRSDPTCPSSAPTPRPGTYRATWSVLGVEADVQVFVLTDNPSQATPEDPV